ncbi:MAG: hypothetical protein IAF02_20035 [Anaerolineae bacterium]|nr:hypothetical protein [Anaerolineae bacterium]
MKNKQSEQLSVFRQLLTEHFNEAELRTLCFDLNLDFELLPGREKSEKARELIAYYQRTNALDDLLQACKNERQNVEWPQITNQKSTLSPAQSAIKKRPLKIGVGLFVILIGVLFLIFITGTLGELKDKPGDLDEVLPTLGSNCIDGYFGDIQQDYQETVAVGESAHDFYFSDWGSRENPSLLGLKIIQSGKPIAAVRFSLLPGNIFGRNTEFKIVGVIDGNCQEVGAYSQSAQLVENFQDLNLELPDRTLKINFNWQGDYIRWGIRQLGEALPSVSSNCIDTYFEDIQQDYQETVAVGETAHDFYFSGWGSRENPSLLGLRVIQSGKPIAAVRFLLLPDNSVESNTSFEIVGVVDGNCQEVGDYKQSSILIEDNGDLILELPDKTISIDFNWQGDHIRWSVWQ